MNLSELKTSLVLDYPPEELTDLPRALWYDAKGDWESAHDIAQTREGTPSYDHLHAYLHRKEGDRYNANYWYTRAGKTMPSVSLEQEWESLAILFLKN
ncbi:hypothetical protein SAMN04515674_102451 [Pseudarcicella hirudinis]|uniref:Uncharacterized protein n=1 Tax=Pseudarcicella hirudinis TaxID=1079859 RepID=A0A1I5PFF4_9BACT|nr:hypothetical protein [Pseudarcicella hirudinis]SFP32775.1 hypothetical protein SAMN04515674_102451 [Pseudarcicella hirudinis]